MRITNNKIIINKNEKPLYEYFERSLVKIEDESILPVYTYTQDGLEFGRGLGFLLRDYLADIKDESVETLHYTVSYDFKLYESILPGYTLREDQIVAIIKALETKRGILQMATGSGKSLCIAGILKYITKVLGYTPPAILLEPTNYLVSEMCDRMTSYGVLAERYTKKSNLNQNRLFISHPIALYKELQKDPSLLNGIKILIADEAHHEHSVTWSKIFDSCNSIEMSLGFSAYLVDSHKIDNMTYGILSYNEAKAIACTGAVLMNLDTSYYIRLGILATPVLIRMFNPANELVWDEQNWQELRVKRLESKKRLDLLCQTIACFSKKGYKTLVLSSTKKFAMDIICGLSKLEDRKKMICSFGSDEYWEVNDNGECQLGDSRLSSLYKDYFAKGKITTMVCTSHMFEGADIPNLDVVILAEVGKKVRKVIQGVGRGLRKTKKGKYAYIVDFTDHEGGALSHHSKARMDCYRSLIGIEKIYDSIVPDQIDFILNTLEGAEA